MPTFTCERCCREFRRKDYLQKHLHRKFPCKHMEFKKEKKRTTENHPEPPRTTQNHPEPLSLVLKEKDTQCEYCGIKVNKKMINRHQRNNCKKIPKYVKNNLLEKYNSNKKHIKALEARKVNIQNSTVNSNNTTNSKTYNGAGSSGMPVYSAISPSYMSTGPETCFRGNSQGLQLPSVAISRGGYKEDPECNRRRDAKVLSDLGMKVAAVARMCQNPEVWRAMFISGTPCPVLQGGKLIVGKRAYLTLKTLPALHIPDYEKKKDWYNAVLGIGVENEQAESGDTRSISERFRSSASGSSE